MQTIKIVDPRVDVKADVEKNHAVLFGGQRVSEQIHVSSSWGSAGTKPQEAQWSVFPPSTTTIVDRHVRVRCYFDVVSDVDLQIGTNDALRQFPIHAITETLTCQINSESISDNVGDSLHPMLCFVDRDELNKGTSTTPTMPDFYQNYHDYGTAASVAPYPVVAGIGAGTGKSSLAEIGENGFYDGRGGFPIEVIDAKHFRVVVTEPIMMSPFRQFGHEEEGFVNVNDFNINYKWKTDLTRILSHSMSGNALTALTVTMYAPPELLMTYITPNDNQPVPAIQILPYHKPLTRTRPQAILGLAAGAIAPAITSDSYKLSQVPRKMYIWAKPAKASATFATTDSYAALQSLRVLWGTEDGLFGRCRPQELYEISRRNGYNKSFPMWSKYSGSVFCCEFGSDIGLPAQEAPGVAGQFTIQVEATFKNTGTIAQDYDFTVMFLNEGTFSISDQMARASLGNLTNLSVLAARESPQLNHMQYSQIQGGSFFSKLKNVVNKIARGVQRGVDVAERVAPAFVGALPQLSPLAASLPAIRQVASGVRGLTGGSVVGGRLSRGRRRG